MTTTQVPVTPGTTAPSVASALKPFALAGTWHTALGRRTVTVSADLVTGLGCAAVVHAMSGSLSWALVACIPLVWVLVLAAAGGYVNVPGAMPRRGRAVVRASALLGLTTWVVAAAAPGFLAGSLAETARLTLLLVAMLAATGIVGRILVARSRTDDHRAVILGDAGAVAALVGEMRRWGGRRGSLVPVAACLTGPRAEDADVAVPEFQGLGVQLGTDELEAVVATHNADAVIVIPGPWADQREIRRIGWKLQDSGTPVMVEAGLLDVHSGRLGLTRAGGMRLLHVRPAPLTGLRKLVKHTLDRVLAAVLLLLLAPVFILLTALVRADSPGPAIYRQVRVGHNGRTFTMLKLRTMCVDADRELASLLNVNESDPRGALFKIRQDPRITRIGAVLRQYSLDELPQLVNVLRGEMSLVGPRPALPAEVERYSDDVRRRLVVRPGLTGLWQVSGRSDLSWEDTVRLDLRYVDNWSFWLDLLIAARTTGAVLRKRGAY